MSHNMDFKTFTVYSKTDTFANGASIITDATESVTFPRAGKVKVEVSPNFLVRAAANSIVYLDVEVGGTRVASSAGATAPSDTGWQAYSSMNNAAFGVIDVAEGQTLTVRRHYYNNNGTAVTSNRGGTVCVLISYVE